MSQAEKDGRIRKLVINEDMPLHFVFDLGFDDDTALIAWQDATDGYPIMHAEADHYRPIAYYIARIEHICKQYGVPRGEVWLPHDAKAKSLQTGRSIVEQFISAGIKPRLVPRLDVIDGISAARLLFHMAYFNIDTTKELIMALNTYRRRWDEDKKAFSRKPVDDWSTHYADTFRYWALIVGRSTPIESEAEKEEKTLNGSHYTFNLEDLWGTNNEYLH
jgi:phage terminase large subunit